MGILRSHSFLNIYFKQHCFVFIQGDEYEGDIKISTLPWYCLLLAGRGVREEKIRETALIVKENQPSVSCPWPDK